MNFVFCVHNHQPVGNFDSVFFKAYEDAYLPFLKAVENRDWFRFCAHYSGPLLEWLEQNKLETFILLNKLVEKGRAELISGGFYEPIFPLIPEEDIKGQIKFMNDYLNSHFGQRPAGVWTPERVWETYLVRPLKEAGVRYTILDDFHFKAAGLSDSSVSGYYSTEHSGDSIFLFPIKEALRYSIPFKDPKWTIDYLKSYKTNDLIVYADDGEKFGIWPKTNEHVWSNGWFNRFLDEMEKNLDTIKMLTFSEALDKTPSKGPIYLPSCSYREMGEWSLLNDTQGEYKTLLNKLKDIGIFDNIKQFMPGGNFRNFLVKYAESKQMYERMLGVSRTVSSLPRNSQTYREAVKELYKSQCNCAYWHGVFGGIYLPYLREAIYKHLIRAEKIMEKKKGCFGYESEQHIKLYNNYLTVLINPSRGGHIVELDVKQKDLNICSAFTRRREHYHDLVSLKSSIDNHVKTIHEIQSSKTSGIEEYLVYDSYQRESLVDHLPDAEFIEGSYACSIDKEVDSITAKMTRSGSNMHLEKKITLYKDSSELEIAYKIKNEGSRIISSNFGIEFNFSGFCPSQSVSFIHYGDYKSVHPISASVFLQPKKALCLYDSMRRLNIKFKDVSGAKYKVEPIYTVSQSESGFESVLQSISVMPTWEIKLEPKKWCEFTLILSVEVDVH